MISLKSLRAFLVSLPLFLLSARAAVVNATWNSAAEVPVTAASYTATGNTVNFTLNHAPATGTNLTVVNNTGLPFIQGAFGNLAQGQAVALVYAGITYDFVANYYGGTGNDLVLQWAKNRPIAWGSNGSGQLGDNSTTQRNIPTPVITTGVLSGKTLISMTGGITHSLALCSDGSIAAWGANSSGQLGTNSTAASSVPIAVIRTGALLGKTVVALAAGSGYSLALCSDGTVAAWGGNSYGQLGNNDTTSSLVPVLVNATGALAGKTVVAISAGSRFNLALCSDGTLVSWGYNSRGQLGNGTTTNSLVPVAVSTSGVLLGKIVTMAVAGAEHSMVLTSEGKLYSWGYGQYGQLGRDTSIDSSFPVAVDTTTALASRVVTRIAAGDYYSLAVCADGAMTAWGDNGTAQLGDNSSTRRYTPVQVLATSILVGKTPIGLFGGTNHSLALCSDGTLAAWGYNLSGQLGNNSTSTSYAPTAVNTSSFAAGERCVVASSRADSNLAIVATPLLPPVATINAATALTVSSATLNGSVINGANSNIIFEYGLTTSYGSTVTATPSPVTSNTATPVSANITGLVAGTTYHYRVKATNTLGTSFGSDETFTTVNTNSNLSGLAVNTGTLSPTFASSTTNYTASVSNTTTSITVMPTLADTSATVRVNGGLVSSGAFSSAISLVEGSNLINTVVTAQDGVTTKTYVVTVTRLSASVNADLAGLTLSTGSLSPAFASGISTYSASVTNATASITVRPTLADLTATVRVNGVLVSSGSNSSAISLAVGPNLITIVVTAQDGVATQTYTVTVTRPSANADLASLSANAGAFSPAFTSPTTSYTMIVTLGVSTLRVTPTVADAAATVKVNGVNVNSGSQSGVINLGVGSNSITILVTAQSGATKNYTLTVTRNQTIVYTFNSASDVAASTNALTATGNTVNLSLNFAPQAGTNLMVVNNTGSNFITGTFSNLAHGQIVTLSYGGVNYQFVANYYGGTGNDLVLQWANTRLFAWGTNGSGQLGNNSITDSPIPTAVNATGALAGKSITSVAVGSNHSIALSSDGRIAAWGYNGFGQLGIGTTADSLVPVSVTTTGVLSGKTPIAIAAGQFHNLALCTDGTLAAWGYNFYGQLGNGLTSDSSTPVAVSKTGVLTGKTIIAIAAGTYHSFALCSDGTLAAWGYNGNGELGNGGTGFSPLPVAVDTTGVLTGKTIVAVFAGSFHNFALCTDGTLAGWGYNGYGQLGDNSVNSRSVPVLVNVSGVLSGKTITAASAGYYHSLALCADGTVVSWGYNGNGELGDGSNNPSLIPVAVNASGVLAGKTVASLSSGAVHNIASCTDGTLVSWGYNGDGELGSGGAGSSNVPVTVNSSALLSGEFFAGGWSGSTGLHGLAIVASPPPSIVTTLAASSITATSAVLNGTVNSNGSSTAPSFDYGLTTNYGTTIAGTPSQVSGTSSIPVSATVSGLSPGTTYHYRVNGTSSGGTIRSANVIFTTSGFNANLSNLALSSSALNPVFSSATTGYTATVPSTITTISVTPTVATPTSTVRVNGASVVPGSASTPIFLLPGNNTINVTVTAQDAVTTKTYTISVTRLSPTPEIDVTQSAIAISDGGIKDFGPATAMRPAILTFVIVNTGNSNLTGLGITIDGPDAAQFSLPSLPTAPVSGPAGSTTFTVGFTPAGVGTRSAALHISSNDADENPYDIALSGTGLSSTLDTDGDGLNDAAEFQMEALGFDWQVSQPALVNVYFANAETGGQGLQVGSPKLSKNPTTGLFKLQIGIQKSTDLLHFTPFPMTSPQTTITGDGKLEFEFSSPDNAAFYRLLAE